MSLPADVVVEFHLLMTTFGPFPLPYFQVTVPPWPFFRVKPLKWQKSSSGGDQGSSSSSDAKAKKKK